MDEQHRVWAAYSAPMVEYLGKCLKIDQAILLGRGEMSISRDPKRQKRTYGTVTGQIIGAVCLLEGFTSVSKLVETAYQKVVTQAATATNWPQTLSAQHREGDLAWEYQSFGPDHQVTFEARDTDRRGRTGKGSSSTKSGARSAAAEDFVRRHMPTLARSEAKAFTREQPRESIRPTARYTNVGAPHEHTLRELRETFELPPSAIPLLTQALTHPSGRTSTKPWSAVQISETILHLLNSARSPLMRLSRMSRHHGLLPRP